jgi:hypothetical protein
MSSPWPSPDPEQIVSSTEPPPSPPPLNARLIAAIVGGIALLVIGLIGLANLMGDDDERPGSAVATTAAPEATSAPGTSGRPSETTSAVATTVPSTATPTIVATTVPASSLPASTVPATATTPAPVAPPQPVPPPPPAPPTAPSTPEAQAVALAQQFEDALAAGRWDEARALNPGRGESDEFLEQTYGAIVGATIIPATTQPRGDGRVDLRIGVVSHEQQPTGAQSVLLCALWRVDVDSGTITRIDFTRLRVEPGFVDPAARADELRTTCATAL